ncbi:MAG: amidase [Marmoricola sp.]
MADALNLDFSSAVQQVAWVADGTCTARDLVEHSLSRIATLDPHLNAFAFVRWEDARREADELDVEMGSSGPRGPLHGLPIAIKEENDVAGIPTQFGGGANGVPAKQDSEVVRRLRAAGAVVVGTTRMPEFGIWPYTESVAHGWTRNPWDLNRSTAGSSGGTAAAVASGMVAVGIGGDGGGSIRLPSSWCGLFGLKPQRGRVSLAPNADLWRSLGVIGPLARTVEDSALIYDVISGPTATDRFAAGPMASTMLAAARTPLGRPLRIMVSAKNPMGGPDADADTLDALMRTADDLRRLGHEVIEDDPHYPSLGLPFQVQVAAGVRDEARRVAHPELLERRTRTLLRLTGVGAMLGRAGEKIGRRRGEAFVAELFSQVDLLLMPTTPTTAKPIGQLNGVGALAATRKASGTASFTSMWNVCGNPAASVPAGFTDAGLPLSVQVVGPTDGEPLVLALSAQLEATRPWAVRRPAVRP